MTKCWLPLNLRGDGLISVHYTFLLQILTFENLHNKTFFKKQWGWEKGRGNRIFSSFCMIPLPKSQTDFKGGLVVYSWNPTSSQFTIYHIKLFNTLNLFGLLMQTVELTICLGSWCIISSLYKASYLFFECTYSLSFLSPTSTRDTLLLVNV